MRRILLLAVCMVAGIGCVTAKDKADWADAMKDARGDNMQMRSGPGATDSSTPAATKSLRD